MYAFQMGNALNRREFLTRSAAGLAGSAFLSRSRAQTGNKLDRVAVMTSYFGTRMPDTRDKGHPAVTKDLNILDFPEMIADHFHIHHVEVQQMYFPSTEPSYFKQFQDRLKKAKSRVSNMPLEFDEQGTPGIVSVCSADSAIRERAIGLTKEWIDHAAVLGSPSVMVNQGPLEAGKLEHAIEGLRAVSAYGKSKNVVVTIENRGNSTPEVLVEVIKASGIYANPDIGNFRDDETRKRGLRMLYPLSHGNTHVKLMPDRFDFAQTVAISKEMGYKGIYSIEANRSVAPDPFQAVQIVLDDLLKVI
jgi:sugar phosphate isomerase/epimerase